MVFDIFLVVFQEVGTFSFRQLPRPFQRQVAPDSIIGQAVGIIIGIALVISALLAINHLRL